MKMSQSQARNGKRQRGFSLIEMMIAMVVLAVGLGALTILFTTAMYTNTKSNKDTTATMLAQTAAAFHRGSWTRMLSLVAS